MPVQSVDTYEDFLAFALKDANNLSDFCPQQKKIVMFAKIVCKIIDLNWCSW